MYRSTGFVSFLLRRITGVALVLYLLLHIWVIGGINSGADTFNSRMEFLGKPFFRVLEIGLLAAVVYHGIDGIRLLMVHYLNVTEYRKSLFYAALVVSAILVIAGGLPILLFALEG
ncbi:MAG TPA: succinate dehydrogenase, cytochrome b556 subunit [Aggregatilineaceae bacterium]|jgi:succinate dehydrogenase / fumarate reductase cytochrome b subunit|nr:succinate dehydrogenase, cytochrome b556 subunit [Aggregatilineaceae bacterium]